MSKNNWKQQAVALMNTETMSWREIARVLDKGHSTVSDYLRKQCSVSGEYQEVKKEFEEVDNSLNARILWITDLHAPFHHKKTISFLKGIKEKYNPTRVICAGDETDQQSHNMHGVNPDLPSAGDELRAAKEFLKELAELFPVMDIMESNHTSLAYRRAFKAGISKGFMKSYNEMFDAPDTWVWHDDLLLTLPNGQDLYCCHGKSSDGSKLSKNMSCNVLQGHFHSKFSIQYWSSPRNLYWSMQAGCMIDDKSMAMAYNKLTLERPIIGVGLVINSLPVLEAMSLRRN